MDPHSQPISDQDEEQLRLLSIFHYVVAGLMALFSMLPIFHLIFGLFMVFAPQKFSSPGQQPPPAFIGWIFIAIAVVFITAGLIMAVLMLLIGRFISRCQYHTFCFVMAAVECLFFPFGTVLGVFSIIILNRTSVKQIFSGKPVAHQIQQF